MFACKKAGGGRGKGIGGGGFLPEGSLAPPSPLCSRAFSYMRRKSDGETLEDFLSKRVFATAKGEVMAPVESDVKGFDAFLERYSAGLPIEKAATECLK